jgi:hypothetical protein
MKNKSQIKKLGQIKRRKQSKKKKQIKTNTVSIERFKHRKHFLLQVQMFERIIMLLFSPQWQTLKNSIPGFSTGCDKLKTLTDALNNKYRQYSQIIKTVAREKNLAKQSLAETGFRIMSSCRSFAVKNGLTELAGKMDVNLSDLLSMKYRNLIALMNNSSALIRPLIPLIEFIITQEIYDDWQTKILDAESIENGPKSAIQQRTSIACQLLVDMRTTMEFFDNEIVPLATNFRSNDAFWFAFVTIKRIGKVNTHHCRLLAHCEDELGNSVYGLTVTVDDFTDPATGKTYKAVSAVTDPNGDADVIEFFAGNRTVTISGSNIETKTFPAINFERGKPFSQSFTVTPTFTNIPAPQENKEKVNN